MMKMLLRMHEAENPKNPGMSLWALKPQPQRTATLHRAGPNKIQPQTINPESPKPETLNSRAL